LLRSIESQSITDMTSTLFNFIGVTFNIFFMYKISRATAAGIDKYPNYIYVYMLHLVSPMFFMFFVSIVYYCRNPAMRKTMMREAKAFYRITD
jgi:hypothetical protein